MLFQSETRGRKFHDQSLFLALNTEKASRRMLHYMGHGCIALRLFLPATKRKSLILFRNQNIKIHFKKFIFKNEIHVS